MPSSDSDEDRKERDKFSERLKRKDKERTRNIAIPRSGMFTNSNFKIRRSSNVFIALVLLVKQTRRSSFKQLKLITALTFNYIPIDV